MKGVPRQTLPLIFKGPEGVILSDSPFMSGKSDLQQKFFLKKNLIPSFFSSA